MKLFAALAVALALSSCLTPSSPNASSSARKSTPTGSSHPAASKAADLRTELDLLLGEQVMLVAKQSAAAVNHSEEYTGYTALLTVNRNDLRHVLGLAFGDTAATQLWQLWGAENSYLVDYAIGIVTHNHAKSDAAISGLNDVFVPHFAALINSLTQLPQDSISALMSRQVLQDKAVIDDQAAQKPASTYSDLHAAFVQSGRLGDALSPVIAEKFPDKFPGDPTLPAVDRRVWLNTLLEEHSYLTTMTTAAIVRGDGAEKAAGTAALTANAASLRAAFSQVRGDAAGTEFGRLWATRMAALIGYAESGDAASAQALTQTFAPALARLAGAGVPAVVLQVQAALRAIDDQRGKSVTQLAGDDRSAATAMQPIADASAQG